MENKRIEVLKLTAEMKEALAIQIGTMINDEVEALETMVGAYSSSPYFKAHVDKYISDAIIGKTKEFIKKMPYSHINITLIYKRNPLAGNIANDIYFGTTLLISRDGESNIRHQMVVIQIPTNEFKQAGIIELENGTYAYASVTEVYTYVEDEPNVPETTETVVADESEVTVENTESTEEK